MNNVEFWEGLWLFFCPSKMASAWRLDTSVRYVHKESGGIRYFMLKIGVPDIKKNSFGYYVKESGDLWYLIARMPGEDFEYEERVPQKEIDLLRKASARHRRIIEAHGGKPTKMVLK